MLKVNNWHRSGVFIVNFEHNSHLALVFLLLTLNMSWPAGYYFPFPWQYSGVKKYSQTSSVPAPTK